MNEIQLKNHIREDGEIIDLGGQKGHILQQGNDIYMLFEYDTTETARTGLKDLQMLGQIDKIIELMADIQHGIIDLEESIQEASGEIEDISSELEDVSSKQKEFEDSISDLTNTTDEIKSEIEEMKNSIDDLVHDTSSIDLGVTEIMPIVEDILKAIEEPKDQKAGETEAIQ